MASRVPKKDAWGGAGLKFMSGVNLGKAKITKYPEVIIGWMFLKKAVVGCFIRYGNRGKYVENMGFHMEGLRPKSKR